ncbi:MAG TPA: hypothetical protein VMR97_13320 [Acidimicrobiales bacterium]|nr:hypothetical protein [Acidimicrobiales bacterium]
MPWFDLRGSSVDSSLVTVLDFTRSIDLQETYDLALCFEIAEHLPASRAESFVADLSRLAPIVAFSAAIPGQGGTGHLNEQWPEYWERLFSRVGYLFVDALRRPMWRNPGGPAYLAQNLFLAVDERRISAYPFLEKTARANDGRALGLVHPDVFKRFQITSIHAAARNLAFAIIERAQQRLHLQRR